MSATLELLRLPDAEIAQGRSRQRRFQRFHFDQRVSISYVADGKEHIVYGRTSDLSERAPRRRDSGIARRPVPKSR